MPLGVFQAALLPDGDLIWALTIALTVLGGVAVALRFLTRAVAKMGFGADDWWALTAFFSFMAEQGIELYALNDGLHAKSPTDPLVVGLRKYIYIVTIFYFVTNTAVRFAILYYLRRIFVTPKFRRVSMVVIVVCALWFISGFVTALFACIPMESIWTNKPGRCVNPHIFWVAMTPMELLLDIIIMVLPIREILQLHMSVQRKVSISLVFLLGSFVILTSAIRMGITNVPVSPGKRASQDLIWLEVHVASGLVCACLPTYLPLLTKVSELSQRMIFSLTSRVHSSQGSQGAVGNTNASKETRSERRRSMYKQMDEARSDNFVLIEMDKGTDKAHM